MDNNLDILKKHWQGLSNLSEAQESEMARNCRPASLSSRPVSNTERLKRNYRVLGAVAIIYVVLGPLSLSSMNLPLALLVYLSAFFGLMGLMCILIYQDLRELDFSRQTTIQLLNSVKKIINRRRLHRLVGIIAAAPLLAVMLYNFYLVDQWVFMGGICGLIIGLIVGILNERRTRRWLNEIKNELMALYTA